MTNAATIAKAQVCGEALHGLHVVLSLDCGGLERVVLNLVRLSQTHNAPTTVLCLERPGALAAAVAATGAQVVCMDKPPGWSLSLPGKLASHLRTNHYDVVHTHQIGCLFYVGRAAKRAGLPIVHTEHGRHDYHSWRRKLLARWAARYCDRFACVTKDIADSVVSQGVVPKKKVLVVPNGVEATIEHRTQRETVRATLGLNESDILIGTVGRLAEVKCQDLLIEAFSQLVRQQRQVHLLLVGDGPRLAELRRLAAGLGVTERVHFAGYQSDPSVFLQAMDVFALTSRSEGMPLALLEAWSAQLPVVASNVGGVPQLVQDRQNGLLFPSGDAKALRSALAEFIDNRPWATDLGIAGQLRVVREYSVGAMASRYDELYRSCAL